jgi:tRNA(His) guanylyltransferase
MQTETLAKRMKEYEKNSGCQNRLIRFLPGIVRVDGRSFHSFTRGMIRPYDPALSSLMDRTTVRLIKETGALVGYTQSDEISLLLYSDNFDSQLFFDGRVQKIVSQTAAIATNYFLIISQGKLRLHQKLYNNGGLNSLQSQGITWEKRK